MVNNNVGSVDVKFTNLVYTVKVPKQNEKKNVLKNISGTFKCGELTAIMGPSGAGKSSLLNILTGFTNKGVTGSIKMGDREANKKSRKLCSYILQDDNLFPWFTVNETMKIAAKLKLTKGQLRNDNMYKIIDRVLESLNLLHTKQTKCSALSGGQRKRLSIALEMLDDPPILFLDEPTTGLDSTASTYCVKLLHKLSREGRTIVCTIHQPSAAIYEMFDHVYVLSAGSCIYQGSALNTVPYLSSNGLQCPTFHSSADYLLEVATGEYGDFTDRLAMAAKNSSWRQNILSNNDTSLNYNNNNNNNNNNNKTPAIEINGKTIAYEMDNLTNGSNVVKYSNSSLNVEVPSEISRLGVLMTRGMNQYLRDWTVTYLKLALHIACAIFIGVLFNDAGQNATKTISNLGLIFIGLNYLWYTTCLPSVLRYPFEISVLKKEIFNNWYKVRTYYISTQLTAIPFHIIFATVYSSVVYIITYQPLEAERILKFIFVHILCTMVADGYGIFFGTIFDPINGTFIGAIVSCFSLALGGLLVQLSHMSPIMYYVSYLSAIRYALEASVISVLGNDRGQLDCPTTEMYCHLRYPDFIIKEMGMVETNYSFDVLLLVVQLILVKILAYFTLQKRLQRD